MRSYVPGSGPYKHACRGGSQRNLRAAAVPLERRGGVAGLVLGGQGGGEPRPRALQPLQADGGQTLAPFPELERLLQGEPPALQPPDHLDELVARLLVGHLRGGRRLAGLTPGGLLAFGLTWLGGHGANLAG